MRKRSNRPRIKPSAPRGAMDVQAQLTFAWAKQYSQLESWRQALGEWASQSRGKHRAVEVGNLILRYLLEHPAPPLAPELFCRRSYTNPVSLLEWYSKFNHKAEPEYQACMHNFCSWFLLEHLAGMDQRGEPVPSTEHWNPVALPRRVAKRSETAREPIPMRLLREAVDLLMADNCAWPRSLGWDMMEKADPTTGKQKKVWCPVRTYTLALKLLLPIRLSQLRRVDSGEGDSLRYNDGKWAANTGRHAPPLGRNVRTGFLRCYETDQGTFTGFWINTNKTAARLQDGSDRGYEMPWPHAEAVALADRLARWQESENPISGPLPWRDLYDRNIQLSAPRSGSVYFLTRDPNGAHHNQPIGIESVSRLWHRLVAEIERRMAARGECLADGRPIRLTRRDSYGEIVSRYGLHAIRVSWLSALAKCGVPLDVLSKSVAGHATVTMTAYYIKRDTASMAEHLRRAEARIERDAEKEFARYLVDKARCTPQGASASVGMLAIAETDGANLTLTEVGMCPVGRSRCSDGGPPMGDGRHAPVPGGLYNCVSCRFLLTGPAFLSGLVARFNIAEVNVELQHQNVVRDRAELREAENRWAERVAAGESDDGVSVSQLRDRLANAEALYATHVGSRDAARRLVDAAMQAQQADPERQALISPGRASDLVVSVRATSSVELMDAVCRASEVHHVPPEIRSLAVQRRGQALDTWLMDNKRMPRFLQMDEEQSLRAGNAATRLLRQLLPGGDLGTDLLTRDLVEVEDLLARVDRVLEHSGEVGRPTSGKGIPIALLPSPEAM